MTNNRKTHLPTRALAFRFALPEGRAYSRVDYDRSVRIRDMQAGL